MTSSSRDAPTPAPPSLLDRDLLDGNLEVKRAQGFACPHCTQPMEWTLGEKTKGEILDALTQGRVHEKLMYCDKNDCPSVERGDENDSLVTPFLRRISATVDELIIVETFTLSEDLQERERLQNHFRTLIEAAAADISALRAAAESETRRADEASRTLGERNGELSRAQERMERLEANQARQIEAIRGDAQERIDEITAEVTRVENALTQAQEENRGLTAEVEEKGRKLGEARQEIERLEGLLAQIDGMIGAKKPEDRLARLQDHVRTAQLMAEVQLLTGRTPNDVLENSRAWAAKQRKRR